MPTFEDYEEAVPDLRPNGLDFSGTCPICGSDRFRIHILGEHEWEASCPGKNCTPITLDQRVDEILAGRNGVNGHVYSPTRPLPPNTPPPTQSAVPRPPEPATERVPRFPLITFDELRALPPPTWQVEDFFLEETLVQVFGETNHGKSLLIWDLACSICLGAETWFGRKILKYGPVVWINADGGRGLTLRANAWAEANGEKMQHPLLTLMGSVHLNQAQQISAFRRQLMAMDPRPVLVVFDTQSRCMPGGDENDQGVMTQVTEGLHRIKMDVGCSVLPIHHTDKTGQWERGSGVVKNETDAQIRVSKDEKSGIFTVSCRKMRDGQPFKDFFFTLKQVGESVVILQSDEAPPKAPEAAKEEAMDRILFFVQERPLITREDLSLCLNSPLPTVKDHVFALISRGLIFEEELDEPGKRGPKHRGLKVNLNHPRFGSQ